MHTGEMTMQYKILASDYDNTLVPFGESKPRQKVVKAVKKKKLKAQDAEDDYDDEDAEK